MHVPLDKHGQVVAVGMRIRLIGLSGKWLEHLPQNDRQDVMSMLEEIFEVEEIDQYGRPWISKSWSSDGGKTNYSHSIAPEQYEMEIVDENVAHHPSTNI